MSDVDQCGLGQRSAIQAGYVGTNGCPIVDRWLCAAAHGDKQGAQAMIEQAGGLDALESTYLGTA